MSKDEKSADLKKIMEKSLRDLKISNDSLDGIGESLTDLGNVVDQSHSQSGSAAKLSDLAQAVVNNDNSKPNSGSSSFADLVLNTIKNSEKK